MEALAELPGSVPRWGAMARRLSLILLALGVTLAGCAGRPPSSPESGLSAPALKARLHSTLSRARAGSGGLEVPDEVLRFYERRGFKPFWDDAGGAQLREAIARAYDDGLDPRDYHASSLAHLDALLGDPTLRPSVSIRADQEILRTDALLALAGDLRFGRLDPRALDPEWLIERPRVSAVSDLEKTKSPSASVQALAVLVPQHETYRRLKEELARLRRSALLSGASRLRVASLRMGSQGPAVRELRQRLVAERDLAETPRGGVDRFDQDLEVALKRYQFRHGITPDGKLGRRTLDSLLVVPEERARQVRANLERWRWLSRDLGERFVVVNAAAFEAFLVDKNEIALRQKAVVGKRYRQTPALASQITAIQVNPPWVVPRTVLVEDILPRLRKSTAYLAENGLVLSQGRRANPTPVATDGFFWESLAADDSPYFLWQAPGPANNLGPLKFVFRNDADVYLHGTPNAGDFRKPERALSSGCIRLENPLALAERLLEGTSWNESALTEAIQTGLTKRIALPRAVPVYLLYWTVWSDTEGHLHYRPDIYQRDARIAEALQRSTGIPW